MTIVRVSMAVAQAVEVLAAAGVASPRADAELLVGHVLGVSRGRLVLAEGLTADQLAQLRRLVDRRAQRVPLQHLTGTAGFRRLSLAVGPGVFIPRPETELLAQWAVDALDPAAGSATVVDLASGSGAVALAIAQERPAVQVYAVERSPAALSWLRRNAAAQVVAGDRPVVVVAGDVTDPGLLADLTGGVDLVVCNPPYVPDRTPVPPEVADHDPPEAVFGGPDGLAVIRAVIDRAAGLLRAGGRFGFEHDERHPPVLPKLLAGWFTGVDVHHDLAGRPRYLTAVRRG